MFKAFLFSGIIHKEDLLLIFLDVHLFLAPLSMLASFENDNSILSPTLNYYVDLFKIFQCPAT